MVRAWTSGRRGVGLAVVAGAAMLGSAAAVGVAGQPGKQEVPAKPAPALPTGAEVLSRYVEATGGKEAYERVTSRVTVMRLEMPSMGMTGSMTMYQQGNKVRMVSELPGVGRSEQGTDGTVVWEVNPATGARLLQGEERGLFLRMSVLNAEARVGELYQRVTTVGVVDVDGRAAYKLALTPANGPSQVQYYDRETGLLLKTELRLATQMGEVPVEIMPEEYREVDGVTMPHVARQVFMGVEQVASIERIENNITISPEAFELPAEVRALVLAKLAAEEGEE